MWGSNIDLMIEDGFGGNIPSTVIDLREGKTIIIREGKGDLDLI